MKIQYIKHSGFLVEFEKAALIFDYYEGTFELPDAKKEVYFFVSHKHGDHYSTRIFEYARKYEQITFILSNEMKMNEKYMDRLQIPVEARDKIRYAHKNERFSLGDLIQVEALTSTDEGVAYLVSYQEEGMKDPVNLYHAGDLNWWTWIGETDEDYQDATRRFKAEMKKLEGRTFDCAFVPLDPRQEERFFWGLNFFMKTTNTKKVYPMHCWEDYSVISKLKAMPEAAGYQDRIVEMDYCGQILSTVE